MAKKENQKKKSGNKKHGRNLVKCARYRAEGRREKNKARRQKKHLNRINKKREGK